MVMTVMTMMMKMVMTMMMVMMMSLHMITLFNLHYAVNYAVVISISQVRKVTQRVMFPGSQV